MKIAFDAKRAFHNNRGLGNYSRDVIRLMKTFAPENEYFLAGVPTEKYAFVAQNAKMIQPQSFLHKKFPSLWRSMGCVKQLTENGIDIYHGMSQELPVGIEKTNIKTIVTIHDAIWIRYPELYSFTYRKIFTAKNKFACKTADKIIAISEQSKRDAIEFLGADESKTEVVYQGCNNIFRQAVSDEQIAETKKKYDLPQDFLLDVGAIEKRKNLENLIRAIAIGKIDMPLVVVGGKSKYAEEMQNLANRLGVSKQIIYQHNIAHEDMPALYKGAKLFVYPSVFEGFGIPIIEAQCAGTPVLTSTGSCFAETGGDAALYANPLNPEDIAEKLNKILFDEELCKKMINLGYKNSERFNDKNVSENLIKTYNSL
ncbi:MAG: glycosyltransferase family 4 protein [Paludibacteraceae bacterium]|nr:glycosyltransferase family 4 protein [Paludibacteraceae bacterium]